MTARKNWFKVPDSITFDALTNDELACLIRLQGYMNTRWARDGKESSERGKCVIDARMAMILSGKRRADVALMSVRHLADVASMSARLEGDVVAIDWPKYAEFQSIDFRQPAPPSPISKTSPNQEEKKTPKPPEAPPAPPAARARRGRRRTVDPRSQEAWPAIRQAFDEHGTKLGEALGIDRSDLIAKRIDDGATVDDLVAAVHGYVRSNGLEPRGDFDPRRFFRPQTVFKAEGFSDRVDAGRGPRPVGSGVSKAAQLWGLR